MPIIFVNAGAICANAEVGAGINISAPASIQSGDIILVIILTYSQTSITPPDGTWHSIRQETEANAIQTSYWHIATGSGDGPWSFSFSSDYAGGVATAWRGVDNTTPIDVSGGSGSVNTATTPSVTPNYSNGMLTAYWAANPAGPFTLDSHLTSEYNGQVDSVGFYMAGGYVAAPAAGVASSTYTSTGGSSVQSCGVIVLKQATAAANYSTAGQNIQVGRTIIRKTILL